MYTPSLHTARLILRALGRQDFEIYRAIYADAEASRCYGRPPGWREVETHMVDENAAARALAGKLGGVRIARQRFPDGIARDVFAIGPDG